MRLFFLCVGAIGVLWLSLALTTKDDTLSTALPRGNAQRGDASAIDRTLGALALQTVAPGLTFAAGFDYPHRKAQRLTPGPTPEPEAVLTPAFTSAVVAPSPLRLPTPAPQPTLSAIEPASSALLSSLSALQTPAAANDDRINPGVRRRRAETTPTVAPTPTESSALPWVSGQSTGFASLAFMHPRARALALAQVDTLAQARVRDPFLAVLADGTFDFDGDLLTSAARELSRDGRNFTLLMYLSSGPTMRRWDVTPITAAFARFDPDTFRAAIQFDDAARTQYQQIAARALTVAKAVREIKSENTVLVVPSLEDNLDQDSYRAIRELTVSVFGSNARIVRNICPGCWPGSDTDSLGDPVEGHTESLLERLGPGDVFTLDGLGQNYDGETDPTQLSLQRVRQLKELAIQREVGYFGLWRKQRQGLGNQLIHPDDRNYETPTQSQITADIALLRYGLELE